MHELWRFCICFKNTLRGKCPWLWKCCCADWKSILMSTWWPWCERFSHNMMILRLKDNSHLIESNVICRHGRWKVILTHDVMSYLNETFYDFISTLWDKFLAPSGYWLWDRNLFVRNARFLEAISWDGNLFVRKAGFLVAISLSHKLCAP